MKKAVVTTDSKLAWRKLIPLCWLTVLINMSGRVSAERSLCTIWTTLWSVQEVNLFTCCSLLVSFCLLLVTFVLVARHYLLVACYILLLPSYCLVILRYFSGHCCYFLHVANYVSFVAPFGVNVKQNVFNINLYRKFNFWTTSEIRKF